MPRLVWIAAAACVLVRVAIGLGSGFVNEDFLITLRYAENLARGLGFVYNPGERVLGTTTPLYTLFLALTTSLALPGVACGRAVNILADGALCLVVYRWMRAAGQERAGQLAAFWVAVHPLHIRWAVSGMETSLVTLGCAWVWQLYTERRYLTAYAALGVVFLLRWDSVLLCAVFTGAVLWRERRLEVRGIALYLLLIAPWLIFAGWYFGSPIPTTGLAKLTVYGWHGRNLLFPQSPGLLLRLVTMPGYAAATLLAGIGAYCAWRLRAWPLAAPGVWLLLYGAALSASSIPLFEWYLVPPLPVYDVLTALGLLGLAERAGIDPSRPALLRTAWAIAGIAGAVLVLRAYQSCRDTQLIEDRLRRPLGLWLKAHSRPTDRIMLEPIGYVSYYSQRPILDLVGLVSPVVLPFWRSDSPSPPLEIARAFRPEWAVLRPRELQNIKAADSLSGSFWKREYELAVTFTYQRPRDRAPFVFLVFRRRAP